MDTAAIQSAIRANNLDGWLLYDFHGLNPMARDVARIKGIVTRRWFALIPADGAPRWLVHGIEAASFADVPGTVGTYRSWTELDQRLAEMLNGVGQVAMEYSPGNAIPYVSRVDAGTIEKVRACGVEVVSSADLVAQLLACWTPEQIALHREAAAELHEIKEQAFALIARKVHDGESLTEYDVVAFMRAEFAKRGMETGDGPICAVGPHAGLPHYEPTPASAQPIMPDQLVLIDLWAKSKKPDAVYADITWTGYTGAEIPKTVSVVFDIVARARDRAVSFGNGQLASGGKVMGWEIDRAVRQVIADCGYGEAFVHRTGHAIGTEVHGIGPNIDDFETQDRRVLRNGMAFSVEPGIYLPDFGIRSEIDCLMQDNAIVVTTLPLQTEIVRLV